MDHHHHHIRRHSSHSSSFESSASTHSHNTDPQPDPLSTAQQLVQRKAEPEPELEIDHDPSSCLSCTRRNVISVFPRFRKVSTRLLSSLYRGSSSSAQQQPQQQQQQQQTSVCPLDPRSTNAGIDADSVPASRAYPPCGRRAALCLGAVGEAGFGLPVVPEHMAKGCSLLKTTSRSAHVRNFRLDVAQQRITWDSRKKKKLAHIDLERIVEIRVGDEALWAVGDESCLPHGSQRLFAIVYHQKTVIKTICLVALTDDSFRDWLDTLTHLVSNRQPITSLAHSQRWRLITINRRWWESDTSGESATEALQFIESRMSDNLRSQPALDLANELAASALSSSPPAKGAARKWFPGATSRSPSSTSLAQPTALGRADSNLQQGQQQQQQQQQRICSDGIMLDVADTLRMEHAHPSIDTVYHDISLSCVNMLPVILSSATNEDCERKPLFIHSGGGESDSSSSSDDGEYDELKMSPGKTRVRQSNSLPMRLNLDLGMGVGLDNSEPFGITQAVFGRFLRDVQKELVSDAEVYKRFREFTQGSDQEVMTAYEFEAYLLSAYNSVDGNLMAEDSECMDKECMDMDLPLNQYYVSTSHNTYLASDQLVGESTVEGYVHALLRGCRCIELDSWDGRGGEPVVCHGHTLTTRILFEDVVIAISRYAFAVSPYPVILSLETHCSLPQQARMATILKKHLGEMLVQAPINGENECILPSPNQLKYRIIIKNKVLEPPNSRPPSLASSQPIAAVMAAATTAAPASATIAAAQGSTKTVSPRSSVAQLKRKVAPELSQLIVYCKAVHFEGFEEGSPEPVFDQVTSVSESAAIQLMRQYPRQYTHYNAVQMTRVYPSFSRFT
ncbi:1-phosphatidylinositol 4,5-bisphosphate phosphodiesterase delta-1, partial [Kickxella alabastrina]